MTCRVALCAVCRMAGLHGCPFRGTPLTLADGPRVEVKKVWPVAPNGMTPMDLEAVRKSWEGRR